jgi:membrane-associated phospholipid phosphatase
MIRDMLCKRLLLKICICLVSAQGLAQGKWEIDILKDLNPRSPGNATWNTINSTAKPVAMAIPFCILAVSLINEDQKAENMAYEMGTGLAIASLVSGGLKILVNRPRPYETQANIYPNAIENGSSFPSSNASFAFATATSLTLITKKWYFAVPAYAWASSVGFSRIYLGQNYPSDILVGGLIGAAGAYAAHLLTKKIFSRKKNK